MYWLVETKEQLEVLKNSGYKKAYIDVISNDDTLHPTQSHVSLVYLRPIEASKGLMIGIHHDETLNVDINEVYEILLGYEELYCRDKKELLHHFPLKTLFDICPPSHTYIQDNTYTHTHYYNRHKGTPDINTIIPVVKHYERCENDFFILKERLNEEKTKYTKFFNDKVSIVFNAIERGGIHVEKEIFEEYFHPIDSEFVYPKFNLKTTTTRPSNSFKGVNYAALNKDNGCRKAFTPQNDTLVEIDISAYHPSIAAKLVNYEFPTTDIHSHFAELYKVDYKKAKELTFKQLYGGVFKQYRDLEFFKRVQVYIDNMWKEFEQTGKYECPGSGYIYYKENLDEMRPQKLFNYVLQNMETSINCLILWDMFHILKGKKTKIVLYTYDSFLFDFDLEELDIMKEIISVFKKYKLNIKAVKGNNYHELN